MYLSIFNNKRDKKIYLKIFLSLLAAISMTVLVLSSVLYINFENISINQSQTFSIDSLHKVSTSMDNMNELARSLAVQIFNDNLVKQLLMPEKPTSLTNYLSSTQLDSYRNSNLFVNSIYIYNARTKTFYESSSNSGIYNAKDFHDQDAFKKILDVKNRLHLLPVPRLVLQSNYSYEKNFKNVYSYFFYTDYKLSLKNDNVIVINVSEDWLLKIIENLNQNSSENIQIIDDKGRLIGSSSKYVMSQQVSKNSYVQKIISSEKSTGYFKERISGKDFLVVYVNSDNNLSKWYFVNLIPYNVLLKDLNKIRLYTILFALFILILGIFISFIVSRRISDPILKSLEQLKIAESEKNKHISQQKHDFLNNVIHFSNQYDSTLLQDKFIEYKIKLNINDPIDLFLLKINDYFDFSTSNDIKDVSLFKFAICNISEELISMHCINECVDLDDEFILVIAQRPKITPAEYDENLLKAFEDIKKYTLQYLSIRLSVTVSSTPCNNFFEISKLYKTVMECSQYGIFYNKNYIIYTDQILSSRKQHPFNYPVQTEKHLVQALILRKKEDVVKFYHEIIESTKGFTPDDFNMSVLRLILTISTCVENIEKNINSTQSYDFNALIKIIKKLDNLEDVNNLILSAFDSIFTLISPQKKSNHNELIKNLISEIEKKFSNPGLCIEMLSQDIEMNSVYVGRIFKQTTSKSVSEYITEVRMKKAVELLLNTQMSVNDISYEVGFSSSTYFFTVFKKSHGITPIEYRQNNQINN